VQQLKGESMMTAGKGIGPPGTDGKEGYTAQKDTIEDDFFHKPIAIFPGGLRAVAGINILLFLRLIGTDMTGKRSVFGTKGPFWEKRRA
jgi:hypothetical protein